MTDRNGNITYVDDNMVLAKALNVCIEAINCVLAKKRKYVRGCRLRFVDKNTLKEIENNSQKWIAFEVNKNINNNKGIQSMKNKYISRESFNEITKSLSDSLSNISRSTLTDDEVYEMTILLIKSYVNVITPIKEVKEEDIKWEQTYF